MSLLADSENLLNTTFQTWKKGYDDQTTAIHVILAMLKDKAKINEDGSGLFIQKTQKNKQHQLEGQGDLEQLVFNRVSLFERAQLDWRALKMTAMISEKESRQNKGKAALVRYATSLMEEMKDDADDQVGAVFYADGNAATNLLKPHGCLSWFGYTQGSQNTTDAFATVPSDTYAGLSTVLGAYGGSGTNSGDVFKANSTSPEWNAFTPVIVNSIYDPGSDPRTWATHPEELIGRAGLHAGKSSKEKDSIDVFCVSRAKMLELRGSQRDRQRFMVSDKQTSRVVRLGFKGVINVDGYDVVVDDDVPATDNAGREISAVGWNFDKLSLELMSGSDASSKGFWNNSRSFYDKDQEVMKFKLGMWGNLLAQIRYQALITSCG